MLYGGLLSYVITFYAEDGSGLSNQEPQLLMRGGAMRKLVIYTDVVAPGNGVSTPHAIRMTEHRWKYFNSVSERSVSRADFLSVLSDVEYVIVKASISNVTMEMVVEAGPGEGGGARLIESCTCPTGYSGLSCQECSSGFFQQPLSELSSQSRRSLFIRPCVQCRCNNHSETCDPDDDRSRSMPEGGFGDFRCSACHPGFEGRYCERCSVGYYGNPSLPGGVCVLCGCSDWGSDSQLCDAAGGQCECKAGVTGRSCDLSCDDECTGMLLDDLQEVHEHFLSVNLSALAAAPYRQLVLLENRTGDLRDRLGLLTSDLTALLQQVPRQLKEVGVSTNKSLSQGALLLESISNLQGSIQELQRETGLLNLTSVEQLDSANQTQLLQEMAAMLENIRAVNLTGANALANQELSRSESLARSLQDHFLSSMASLDNRLRLLHTIFTVKQQQVGGGVASVEGVMEESQLMLDDIISLTEEMTNSSAVEVWGGQLEQVRPLLRRQVEALVVGLKTLDALENVFRAESHAHFLQTHAHSLHSLLYSVCNVSHNVSHNGSRLVQLDSDITHRVDSAHQVAFRRPRRQQDGPIRAAAEHLLAEGQHRGVTGSCPPEQDSCREQVDHLVTTCSLVTQRAGRSPGYHLLVSGLREQVDHLVTTCSLVTQRAGRSPGYHLLVSDSESREQADHLVTTCSLVTQRAGRSPGYHLLVSDSESRQITWLPPCSLVTQRAGRSPGYHLLVSDSESRQITWLPPALTQRAGRSPGYHLLVSDSESRQITWLPPASLVTQRAGRSPGYHLLVSDSESREQADHLVTTCALVTQRAGTPGYHLLVSDSEQADHLVTTCSLVTQRAGRSPGCHLLVSDSESREQVDHLVTTCSLVTQRAELQVNVSMVTSRLGLVRESLRSSALLLRQPIRELQSLANGTAALPGAELQAVSTHSVLQGALQRLHTLSLQLEDSSSVVQTTNHTVRETNTILTHTHSAANEAQSKLQEAEHRSQRLMERMKPLSMLGETLSRNLSDIRELIEQIKVALQVDSDCVRFYKPNTESRNSNTLSLTLKTRRTKSLLFYLGSNTTVDFMALEVHDGKVSLLWDVGSGSSRLEFPAEISNNRWTRVNVTRFGARASLSVHQLESEHALLPPVTTTSPGPARVLDIDRNTGCVGEASLNERNIGLWNYERQEGECGGCFSSPQTEETSFHFDGSGFSLVQKSLRATSTSIVLLFKTLSPGGLLLYLASNNTRDFLSMELVGGHVRLTFDLGSGALILTSNRKYNSGVWYKITLQRSKRKGYLSIMAADQSSEKEVLEAESPGTASDLNRSDLDPIYIGGLPASRPIRRQVVSRSYVGCIKNVEIARSNFDLLRDAYGVRKGCVLEAVRSVSLLSGGFVQIAPPSLGQEAELLFSFSSNNQSGVLLAAFRDDKSQRQHFLSVHLLSGALEAELGEVGASQRVMVVRPDGGTFGDGTKHSVILNINRKSLSVQVDEEHLKSVSLLPGGFPRWSPASFFIGGLPLGEESRLPIRVQGLSRRFRGCIQHLVVGGALVDLSGALKYEGAELDSCLLEKVEVAVLPDDQEVEPTPDPAHLPGAPPTHLSAFTPGALTCVLEAEPAVLPSAVQFGSSKHSHMTFSISPSSIRKSVSLRLSLRSRALVGQLVLLSDAKQMDFIVLRMTGGRLVLSADLGRGPASCTSSSTVNDGEWHTVSGEVSRRSVSLSLDGRTPDSVFIKGNQLDVEDRLFLGGLPHTHSTRRINASSSFSGCVRSVSLNGAMLDLSSPASQHDVTSCFTNDQTGSYFNGSGYAALMRDGYKVGSDVSVAFEFRTSQSEAVLLGISSAKVDAIGLELIHGQVVFNVNNGAGRVSVRSIGPLLCDGLWHHLVAKKTKHSLSLSVDGRSYSTPNPYPQSTSAETNNPVYLGGFPVGVKQNCLSVSSRFSGCLRKLHLIKSHLNDALELSSAHFLLGVTPNSCPVAKQHVAQL
ncbi:hypothetical protein KUCAC02_031907 [Chaenocephalus aceratus]|nr:hypothetical protein KUCAC02_031907 [Chaenocephalus aceratus]